MIIEIILVVVNKRNNCITQSPASYVYELILNIEIKQIMNYY